MERLLIALARVNWKIKEIKTSREALSHLLGGQPPGTLQLAARPWRKNSSLLSTRNAVAVSAVQLHSTWEFVCMVTQQEENFGYGKWKFRSVLTSLRPGWKPHQLFHVIQRSQGAFNISQCQSSPKGGYLGWGKTTARKPPNPTLVMKEMCEN